jgi:tRNA A-37 threonylcarbamoyl transferase component Bud32
MNEGEKDDSRPAEPKTLFEPAEKTVPPVGGQGSPQGSAAPQHSAPVSAPPAEPVALASTPPATQAPPPPGVRIAGRIQVGDVLNHMFRVDRFLARGGMGEVFEGANVQSEERVAIKVMLPALAADENVQAMFRKEARTLTKLAHPALVQYRVLAQEPALGVLYIVTEFIDGTNLSDVLKKLKPTPAEVRALGRRLADGLKVAHGLGAIHRDISPDNVLLEGGRLDRARVIDFGIAKDLDPGSKTIVGDGFAGKLNYVAPEQLGDFGREVGPWSDVYSLGLVLLAVALGREVDMGGTPVDAVDKRRKGPDLSGIPAEIRAAIKPMLVADPAQRLRSMDEVIAVLDGALPPSSGNGETMVDMDADAPTPSSASGYRTADTFAAVPVNDFLSDAKKAGSEKKASKAPLFAGIGAAVLLLGGVGGYLALSGKSGTETASTALAVVGGTPREQVESALPAIACSWLDISSEAPDTMAMTGVAEDPASARSAIATALSASGAAAPAVDIDHVWAAPRAICQPLEAFRTVRDGGPRRIFSTQPEFELQRTTGGTMAVNTPITVDIGGGNGGVAIYGIDPKGLVEKLADSRAEFLALANDPANQIKRSGPNSYTFVSNTDHVGLSGIVLISGREPFDPSLLAGTPATRGPDWVERFKAAAQAGGWRTQMVWYRTVDNQPG